MRNKINVIRCMTMLLLHLGIVNQVKAQIQAASLDRQFKTLRVKDSLPGLAVVLVNSNGIVHNNQFGYADIGANKPYSLHTVQPIGSVSKMILAVALMKATELGYFNLDTDIHSILPFKVINPYQPDQVITIRELATHTSGIKDNPEIFPNTYKFHLQLRSYSKSLIKPLVSMNYQQKIKDSTMREFYHNYLAVNGKYYSEDNFVTGIEGRTYVYSNIATALVAYLIEIKSGMSYNDFTAKYILKPLQMTQSGWFTNRLEISSQARLYYSSDLCFPLYDLLTYPDGGLKTNALDLSKFLMDMINGLSGRSVLLKAESFQTMFTPQFSTAHPTAKINLEKRNKGIFWNLYTNGTIGHDGDDPGVSSYLLFNPSTGIGGLFMSNKYVEDKTLIFDMISGAISKQ